MAIPAMQSFQLRSSKSHMETLVQRLRKRAEIRRSIPRGEPDRISDILEEAANRIVELEDKLHSLEMDAMDARFME